MFYFKSIRTNLKFLSNSHEHRFNMSASIAALISCTILFLVIVGKYNRIRETALFENLSENADQQKRGEVKHCSVRAPLGKYVAIKQ